MIGDSDIDVAAARHLGAPVIVVAHGYSETAPAQLGADAVITGFSELVDAVARLAAQRAA